MKLNSSQKRIDFLSTVLLISATVFIALSFAVFYFDTVLEKESLYTTLVRGVLIFDFIAIVIGHEIMKREKRKSRNSAYTFMVIRK
ncbi:hypothetical protein [Pseudotenacibaculum haliotis]|uniref:Uncharacterized protein n=1 Tax=Pseudotenacibaculum haliotis TaxID=1862138 RepID=A0ABW5LVJ3_9FLAO